MDVLRLTQARFEGRFIAHCLREPFPNGFRLKTFALAISLVLSLANEMKRKKIKKIKIKRKLNEARKNARETEREKKNMHPA